MRFVRESSETPSYRSPCSIPSDDRINCSSLRSQALVQTSRRKRTTSRRQKSVVPDGVTGPETNPLRNRTVLLLGFGKLLLGAEGLLGLFTTFRISTAPRRKWSDGNRIWRIHRRDDNDSKSLRFTYRHLDGLSFGRDTELKVVSPSQILDGAVFG